MSESQEPSPLSQRFRGYFPVIVDVETGGFNASTDALLEIAAVTLTMNSEGDLELAERLFFNVEPFPGANMEPSALQFTGIDPHNPLRDAKQEEFALKEIFRLVRSELKSAKCKRAILVGHNAFFDMEFLRSAVERCEIKRNPFHPFSSFDTATLGGLAYGQTVLARACEEAGIAFDNREAHSAIYDAEKTAELFCKIVNTWRTLGGWPLSK